MHHLWLPGRSPLPRGADPTGFTLVELLVVIAIISLLAGLLLPLITRSQQSAKATNCLGNMRQIMILQQYYSQTYGGFLPFNYGYAGPFPWDRPILDIPGRLRINFKDGEDSNPRYSPSSGQGPLHHIHFGSWFVLLAELSEGNYEIFWCPGKPPHAHEDRPDYGQNKEISWFSGDGIFRGPGNFVISRDGLSEMWIKHPSRLLIYADAAVSDSEDQATVSFRYLKYSLRLAHNKGEEGGSLYGPGNWHPSVGGDEGSFVGGHHAGNAALYDRVIYWNNGPLADTIWLNE